MSGRSCLYICLTGKDVWQNHKNVLGPVSLIIWLSLERSEWQGRKFACLFPTKHGPIHTQDITPGKLKEWRLRSESASNIFRSHYTTTAEIRKRNNHRSFWVFVRSQLGQENRRRHRFWQAPFSRRISVHSRPNCRNIKLHFQISLA